MSTEKVTVKINASARVHYSAFVEMTRAEFEKIKSDLESLPGRAQQRLEEDLFNRHIDVKRDWQDEDDIEVTDFDLHEGDDA